MENKLFITDTQSLFAAESTRIGTLYADVYNQNHQLVGKVNFTILRDLLEKNGFTITDDSQKKDGKEVVTKGVANL